MTTQQKNTLCRGVNLGSTTNGLSRFRETVVGRADLLSAFSEEDQPRTGIAADTATAIHVSKENKSAVTIREDVECKTLPHPLLVVKVPIEYLDENGLTVFEVPICPDMRCGELMKRLSRHVPNTRELEILAYPSQLELCPHANVYDLAVERKQRLQLRKRLSWFTKLRRRLHDRSECACN